MPTSRTRLPALALGIALLAAACGSSTISGGAQGAATQGSTAGASSVPTATVAASASGAQSSAAVSVSTSPSSSACTSPATATLAETEGPYYKSGAPESADLVTAGMTGTQLTLTGSVVDTSCAPLANARVEIWQADAAGQYDNAGYTLRGWVTTDAAGKFTIHTVVPG